MRIFITGSTDGLGLEAARTLIAQGHDVVLHARSPEKAHALAALGLEGTSTRIGPSTSIAVGDLSNLTQTRDIADQVNAIGPMDAVIHNAGIYEMPSRNETEDGHAITLTVNTLAPYLLTALIARPKRLVYLSSGLHRNGAGSLADLDWHERRWDGARAYAESKLHVAALAQAVARRWPDVLANAVDPGWVRTRMGGSAAPVDLATGARTQVWLAASDEPEASTSGAYWHRMQREEPAAEVSDHGFQDALLARLAEMTGVELA